MSGEPELGPKVLPADYVEAVRNQALDQEMIYNLKAFLVGNDKLISTLSLFTALTVFTNNFVHPPAAGRFLSFILLLIALVLFLELRSHFPYGLNFSLRRQALEARFIFHSQYRWNRLGLFSLLLDAALITLAAVTAWDYQFFVLALVVTFIATLFLYKAVTLLRRAVAHIPVVARLRFEIWKELAPSEYLAAGAFALLGATASVIAHYVITELGDVPDRLVASFRSVSWLLVGSSIVLLVLAIASTTAVVQRYRDRIKQREREEWLLRDLYNEFSRLESLERINRAMSSFDEQARNAEFRQQILDNIETVRARRDGRKATNRRRGRKGDWPSFR